MWVKSSTHVAGASVREILPASRGGYVQCASSRTSVASQDAHSNLRSLKCGPVWTTLTSHINSPQEGQCGRSVTNTIEVKTKSVRGTAGSGSGADGARSAVKRLIHGAGSLPWSTERFTSRFTSTDVVNIHHHLHHGLGIGGHLVCPQTKGTAKFSQIKIRPTSCPSAFSVPQRRP